ncbi:ParB/RepB/Spo0J family partition protein [Streptomyces ipomoeae]|uniref:ParB/RepB/Spo0J family partition protein n=1 Tax=Streptomyces ipomoeae TaxID=103232 RepID=UPI0015F0E47B|nr:ParB/RepB/Spo0J family partition protein [Streptomyces ipomoeae]
MPSPENGRKQLHKVEELAATLKSDGMNTAMTVIPPDVFVQKYPHHLTAVRKAMAAGVKYVVHHGHRRLAAAKLAGLETVPILVRHEVQSLRIAAIQENLQRMSLNPIEEGEEFQATLEHEVDDQTQKPYTQRSLAARVGASQTYIAHRVALLRLIPALREAVINHWLKEQGVQPDADGFLLPVRPAATIYARLTADLQAAFVARTLAAEDAAVVCKLREDLQGAFLDGKLTIDEAAEIAQLPPSQQKMPDPLDEQTPQPPAPAPAPVATPAPTPPPAPPAPASATTTPPVPTPREGEAELEGGDGAAATNTSPETSAPGSGGASPQGAVEGTGQADGAGGGGTEAGQETKAAVATTTPRVIEIRESEDLDQLVLTLIETLTDEERIYVREHLA